MGCWNQTCGLTQIHIRAGEPVIVVPLVQTRDDSLCYTTPFWAPFLVPFYSEYNDYGAGENSSGIGLELILNYLRQKAVEIEQGPNEFHDCAVVRETFEEDNFWDAIHEQRLKIHGWGDKQAQVGFVMIKQSIFDHLAANFKLESYDYKSSKTYKFVFNDILADLDPLVEALIDGGRDVSGLEGLSDEQKEAFAEIAYFYEPVERVARNFKSDNHAARWLSHSSSHLKYGFFSNPIDEQAVKFMKAKDAERLKTLLTDYLKLLFIDVVLMSTRKFWSPQAGAGSQNDDTESYRELMAAMAHVLDADDRRWDEEEDDEDDEEE